MNDTRSRFVIARFIYGFIAVLFFIGAVAIILSFFSPGSHNSGQRFTASVSPIVCAVLSYFAARRWKHWTTLASIKRKKTPVMSDFSDTL